MSKRFLKSVYDVEGEDAVRALYDDWSESYDAEISENGYATPARCAAALKACGLAPDAAILDMGCGTGLSGVAMAQMGFTRIDGADLSPGMLDKARARGVHRQLSLSSDLPQIPYDAVAAVGAIGPGAAPISLFETCLGYLRKGGLFVLSLNDHALEQADYPDRLTRALDQGEVLPRFQERGDHLPGINVKSTVYVYEKT